MLATQLKEKTAEVHSRLEGRLDMFNRMQTLEDYKKLLVKFYQFYRPVEKLLHPHLQILALPGREKLHLLTRDLLQLGFTQKELDALPDSHELPELKTLSQAVGTLYVLEGSTLGGQVIARHLSSKLQIIPENGGLFFSGYQNKTMEMWLSFKDFLNHYETSHIHETPNVLESATNTFSTLEHWLCG